MRKSVACLGIWILLFLTGKALALPVFARTIPTAPLFTLPGMDDPVRSRIILVGILMGVALLVIIVLAILQRRGK